MAYFSMPSYVPKNVIPAKARPHTGHSQKLGILIILFTFWVNCLGPMPVQAQEFTLPAPGQMVAQSPAYSPAVLRGIKLDPKNPFRFHFYIDTGDSFSKNVIPAKAGIQYKEQLKQESTKLIKYFLASLTIPEKDLWVNLSPYEKDRIVPKEFGQTEMGRDLLAEDYILKQITASLIYPESHLGKEFWNKVYAQTKAKYGTTNIPINTFNKVWIVPDKAVVYENNGTAFVLENHLKVMLEQDYLSLSHHVIPANAGNQDMHSLTSQIIRQLVIPQLEHEVNSGKNFAPLRQVFYSLILATWYKKKIKDSILNKIYSDCNKVGGVQYENSIIPPPTRGHVPLTEGKGYVSPSRLPSNEALNVKATQRNVPNDVEAIYQQYLKAFKKGVFNYIKQESIMSSPNTYQNMSSPNALIGDPEQETLPRKYFSGGVVGSISPAMIIVNLANADKVELAALKNENIIDALTDLGVQFAAMGQNRLVPILVNRYEHEQESRKILKALASGERIKVDKWKQKKKVKPNPRSGPNDPKMISPETKIEYATSDETGSGGLMGRWKYEQAVLNEEQGTLILKNATRIPRKDGLVETEFLIEGENRARDIVLRVRKLRSNERNLLYRAIGTKSMGVNRSEEINLFYDQFMSIRRSLAIVRDESAIKNRIYGAAVNFDPSENGASIPLLREDIFLQGSGAQIREAFEHELLETGSLTHDLIRQQQFQGNLRELIRKLSDRDKKEINQKGKDQDLPIKQYYSSKEELELLNQHNKVAGKFNVIDINFHKDSDDPTLLYDGGLGRLGFLLRRLEESDFIDIKRIKVVNSSGFMRPDSRSFSLAGKDIYMYFEDPQTLVLTQALWEQIKARSWIEKISRWKGLRKVKVNEFRKEGETPNIYFEMTKQLILLAWAAFQGDAPEDIAQELSDEDDVVVYNPDTQREQTKLETLFLLDHRKNIEGMVDETTIRYLGYLLYRYGFAGGEHFHSEFLAKAVSGQVKQLYGQELSENEITHILESDNFERYFYHKQIEDYKSGKVQGNDVDIKEIGDILERWKNYNRRWSLESDAKGFLAYRFFVNYIAILMNYRAVAESKKCLTQKQKLAVLNSITTLKNNLNKLTDTSPRQQAQWDHWAEVQIKKQREAFLKWKRYKRTAINLWNTLTGIKRQFKAGKVSGNLWISQAWVFKRVGIKDELLASLNEYKAFINKDCPRLLELFEKLPEIPLAEEITDNQRIPKIATEQELRFPSGRDLPQLKRDIRALRKYQKRRSLLKALSNLRQYIVPHQYIVRELNMDERQLGGVLRYLMEKGLVTDLKHLMGKRTLDDKELFDLFLKKLETDTETLGHHFTDPLALEKIYRSKYKQLPNEVNIYRHFIYVLRLRLGETLEGDQAQIANEPKQGGIDLNPAQMSMQIKKDGQDFKFEYNGAEIDAAQVTGVTFTINTMMPVTNLPEILGLNEPADKRSRRELLTKV